MRARITKLMAGLTAVTALAIGGASLASAASHTKPAAPPVTAVDGDTLQQGDQTAADTGPAGESTSESAAESSSESAAEPASSEAAGESSSETAAANDGPGGHADEPGNPAADHQSQGEE